MQVGDWVGDGRLLKGRLLTALAAHRQAPSLFIADAPRILAAADRLGRDRLRK